MHELPGGLGAFRPKLRGTRRSAVVIVRPVSEHERPERGSLLLDEEQTVEDEELWEDDGSGDYEGWYCVRTDPFPCPAPGCTFVAAHMTAAHLVLVWEERDDPNLLWHAQRALEVGPQPPRRLVRAVVRPQRLVLRVGGGRQAGARRPRQGLRTAGRRGGERSETRAASYVVALAWRRVRGARRGRCSPLPASRSGQRSWSASLRGRRWRRTGASRRRWSGSRQPRGRSGPSGSASRSAQIRRSTCSTRRLARELSRTRARRARHRSSSSARAPLPGASSALAGVEGLASHVALTSGRLPRRCTAGALRGPAPARARALCRTHRGFGSSRSARRPFARVASSATSSPRRTTLSRTARSPRRCSRARTTIGPPPAPLVVAEGIDALDRARRPSRTPTAATPGCGRSPPGGPRVGDRRPRRRSERARAALDRTLDRLQRQAPVEELRASGASGNGGRSAPAARRRRGGRASLRLRGAGRARDAPRSRGCAAPPHVVRRAPLAAAAADRRRERVRRGRRRRSSGWLVRSRGRRLSARTSRGSVGAVLRESVLRRRGSRSRPASWCSRRVVDRRSRSRPRSGTLASGSSRWPPSSPSRSSSRARWGAPPTRTRLAAIREPASSCSCSRADRVRGGRGRGAALRAARPRWRGGSRPQLGAPARRGNARPRPRRRRRHRRLPHPCLRARPARRGLPRDAHPRGGRPGRVRRPARLRRS